MTYGDSEFIDHKVLSYKAGKAAGKSEAYREVYEMALKENNSFLIGWLKGRLEQPEEQKNE